MQLIKVGRLFCFRQACCSEEIEKAFIVECDNIDAYFIQKQHEPRVFFYSPFHLRTFIYINML